MTKQKTYSSALPSTEDIFAPGENGTANTQALAILDDGSVQLEHVLLTPIGIQVQGGFSQQEWERLGLAIANIESATQWYLGDWMAYGYGVWGKTYEAVAEQYGYKTKTLYEYAYVAANVQFSIRNGKLSFGHHQKVAAMEPDQQIVWLAAAVEHGWTVRQLAAAIDGTSALSDGNGHKRVHEAAKVIGKIDPDEIWKLNIHKVQEVLGYVEVMRRHLDEIEAKAHERLD